ncbi:MAG: peptidylprolyl isomerase [Bacteroidota bacterium]
MSLRRSYVVVLSIAFTASMCAAQRSRALPTDTLAKIGGAVISAEDLLERIELMPWPEKQKLSQADSAKVKALQSLVAEKVLALEGYKLGIDRDRTLGGLTDALEKLFIRDELYRREVRAKTQVTQQEMATGMKRFGSQRGVLLVRADSREHAETLFRKLSKAKDLLKSLASVSPKPAEVDSITMEFGGEDLALENAAFALQKEKLSTPVKSDAAGWVLLYLTGERLNPDYKTLGVEERVRRVERNIRERKEAGNAAKLYRNILAKKSARANGDMFNAVADTLLKVMIRDSASIHIKSGFLLSAAVLDRCASLLGPLRENALVEMEGGDLSVEAVIEMMKLDKFDVPKLESELFKTGLNRFVKRIAEEEFLTREGRKKNLQNTRRVQHDLGVWSEYWVSQLLLRKLRDSVKVTEEEVRDYFVKNCAVLGKWYEINVREVLSESPSAASVVLGQLQEGKALADIARDLSTRKEWAARGGESGYFSGLQHPELVFYAFDADTGRLLGPVKIPEGYSIFKVLDKRRTDSLSTLLFDTMKVNVRNRLRLETQKATVDSFIATGARELGAQLKYEKLHGVSVTPTNMVTTRQIGFGGEINAVPMLAPQWDWIRKLQPVLLEMP